MQWNCVIMILICGKIIFVCGVWPPEYAIQLEVTETFIISDMFDSDDAEDFSDDDINLIKRSELKELLKPGDEKKYFMLNQVAERKNREAFQKAALTTTPEGFMITKSDEYLYDFDDEPVYAQIIDSDDGIILNKMKPGHKNLPHLINPPKVKREDYNYDKFKNDYEQVAKAEAESPEVLKYVEVTEKEGLKDSAKNIIKFKPTKNCTAAEMKGIGLNAIRCYFKDLTKISNKSKEERKTIFARLGKMLLIWLGVYVIIAVPCWCTRGWCCCCCRCKCCKPRKTIESAKKFLADNPVGVLHVDGKQVTYSPTIYEQYAQQRLEKVVMKL